LKVVEISCLVSIAPGYAIESAKIPLSGSVAGFASDTACSTFTHFPLEAAAFFDGCATEAAAPLSGSGCNNVRFR
jgi:hypothetical protein